MDFDIFDAFLLDADYNFLETNHNSVTASGCGFSDLAPDSSASSSSPSSDSSTSPADTSVVASLPGDSSSGSAGVTTKIHFLPPCRVCNNPASGFHYGVNTCEACKGFFHRSLRRRTSYECCKEGKCAVSMQSRSTCSACRYQRCLAVGMTKDAVKTGRYTHSKRTQDTLEVKRLQTAVVLPPASVTADALVAPTREHQSPGPRTSDDAELGATSKLLVDSITAAFEKSFEDTIPFYKDPKQIKSLIQNILKRYCSATVNCIMFGDLEAKRRLLSIWNHGSGDSLLSPVNDVCPPVDSVGPDDVVKFWLEKLEGIIRSIVNFAKSIPGYTSLPMHDQIVLIKAARPELCHLVKYKTLDFELGCVVDYSHDKGTVNLMPLSTMQRIFQDDDFVRQCHGNARRLQLLDLGCCDIAMLAAIVLVSPDREQLIEPERVEVIQDTLVAALRSSIAVNRGNGDAAATNRFLANLLLQLPLLRTINQRNIMFTERFQRRYPIGLPPLLQECLSTVQPDVHC